MASNQHDEDDQYDSEEDEDYVPSDVGEEEDEVKSGDENSNDAPIKEKVTVEQDESKNEGDKKRVDDLWADFLTDVGETDQPSTSGGNATPSLPTSVNDSSDSNKGTSNVRKTEQNPAPAKEHTVTEIFDFAGEEVRVERVVKGPVKTNSDKPTEAPKRKAAVGGLASAVSQLGKKQKISTLAKSSLDWQGYKKEQGIEEELTTHNRGKDGFLEKQDFLQRADYRQFEAERAARNALRNKK